jgi:hypothetical protein
LGHSLLYHSAKKELAYVVVEKRAHFYIQEIKIILSVILMRKVFVLLMSVTTLALLTSTVAAYELFGGRWSDSDIGNLGIYLNPNGNPYVSSMQAAETSWDNTQTPLSSYTTIYQWQAKVFFLLQYAPDQTWDGIAYLYPSTTSNPYTGGNTRLNTYYIQKYPAAKVQCVQAHEFGHILGLAHETGAVLMNPYSDQRYDTYGIYTPQQDDVDGVNAIY